MSITPRILFYLSPLLLAAPATAQAPPPIELPAMPAGTEPPPATMLPPAEVTAPATPAEPMPSASTLPAVPASQSAQVAPAESAAAAPTQPFSFGDAQYSLLFTPAQINNMKQALMAYEGVRPGVAGPGGELQVEEQPFVPPQAINEPNPYPVFHLSSLVYRAPNDWTVWLGTQRITPKKNEGLVQVTSVAPGQAHFAWKPEYFPLLVQRADRDMFAPVKPVKHKTTTGNTAQIDRQGNQVLFSLKPNQSFSAGHMQTFEGNVAPATDLAPLVVAPAEGAPTTAELIQAGDQPISAQMPPDPDKARMQEQLNNNEMMQGLTPEQKRVQ